jgi:hypothetical protein
LKTRIFTRIFAVVFAAVFVLMVVLMPLSTDVLARAQNNVACDATLTTLLVLAVRDYGFKTTVDLTNYNFGQYAEVWQAIGGAKAVVAAAGTAVNAASTAVEDVEDAVDAAGTAVGEIPGLPGAAKTLVRGAATVVGGAKTAVGGANTAVAVVGQGVGLLPGIIPGEAAGCTQLRTELVAFFVPILQQKK